MDETLAIVELDTLQHRVVGGRDSLRGLTAEQRKRLSIAVEIAANPSVLFMVRARGACDPPCSTAAPRNTHAPAIGGSDRGGVISS